MKENEVQTCPSRTIDPPHSLRYADEWVPNRAGELEYRTCSYCKSVHPEDAIRILKEIGVSWAEFVSGDIATAYIRVPWGIVIDEELRVYPYHFNTIQQIREFLWAVKSSELRKRSRAITESMLSGNTRL